ncbi:MAG: Prolipoprotein diacylglyceryl transferase [Nitrospira sp.]|jgi:phosphatidylglycerol:prolipoprotein diacylglycerol transferase|nr:MAG: Prolipoprotein diacylglyceryl transferase [Nitrospira sp.]
MSSWYRTISYPDIDPVFLRLGPLQFRWYGLMYLIGLTLAYFIIAARAKAQKLPMNRDQVYDMIVYAAVGVFAGGRIGYVLFYNLPYYLENPLKVFAVWEGGMSFHGGLIGTIVALVLFAKRQGMTILTIADLAAGVTPVGLGLGRIGNFINGELFGRPTDVDWCMVFPAGGPACRHPSQLYEALLEGLLLFTVLWLIIRRFPPPGTVFGSFLVGYGLCRIVVEFFREPDAQIGFLFGTISMGQLLSLPMIVGGAIILAIAYQRKSQTSVDSRSASLR